MANFTLGLRASSSSWHKKSVEYTFVILSYIFPSNLPSTSMALTLASPIPAAFAALAKLWWESSEA